MRLDFETQIDQLQSVSLEEANSYAQLQTRCDRKYLIPPSQAASLMQWWGDPRPTEERIPPQVVEHLGIRRSRYASEYFDTDDLLCYKMALQKSRRRFKVRRRTYVDSDQTFLEVKRKSRLGTDKYRVPCTLADARPDNPAVYDFLREHLPKGLHPQDLHSALNVTYRRTTLVGFDIERTVRLAGNSAAFEGVTEEVPFRVTFDQELAWGFRNGGQLQARKMFIVETKTSGQLSSVDQWLWAHSYRPMAVSKYAVGIAAANPQLPLQRWKRAALLLTADAGVSVDA